MVAACSEPPLDCETNPPTVVLTTTSNADLRPALAEAMATQLGEAGIEVIVELEDSQLFFGTTLGRGTFDTAIWAWVGAPGAGALVDIFDVFDPDAPAPGGTNFYRWGSEADEAVDEFRDLLAALRSAVSRDRVFGLSGELETILAEQAVIIPIASRPTIAAVWADRIGGFVHNPTTAGYTWNIERWYRNGS